MTDKMTPSAGEELTYRCAPAIAWLRDADQILLVDGQRGLSWFIRGVEAAIWDWLCLAYPYPRIVRFVSLLLRTSTEEAERRLLATLRGWREAGILYVVEGSERGESGHQRRL